MGKCPFRHHLSEGRQAFRTAPNRRETHRTFSRDLLAEFKAEIEGNFGVTLDPLPEYGSLEPSGVMASEFFFA